jgi:leucyl-tRNA synthetase
MVNSGEFDGLAAPGAAFGAIVARLAERGEARPKVNFKLRDWLLSRQRYWGVPIPIVYCDACGIVPVPAEQLPVLLPELEDYEPTDDARSPLARDPDFVATTCPRCGGPARRETDTMDTFVCSSWYQFRYPSPHDDTAAFDRDAVAYWLPVDLYVGGAEHAVMHLLYSRFFCKVLNDAGYVDFSEPYATLRNQGMILAEDGTKMSKSKGNVVTPDSVVERYGADALRLYELFIAPFEQSVAWNDRGVQGCLRFLTRFWGFALGVAELERAGRPGAGGEGPVRRGGGADGACVNDATGVGNTASGDAVESAATEADARRLRRTLHKTVRKVSGDLETFRFNTAVAALMETLNDVLEVWTGRREQLEAAQWHEIAETFILLLAPMTPHIAEELWQRLGHDSSVLDAPWPSWDEALAADEVVTVVVQVNGKLRDRLEVPVGAASDDVVALARAAHNTVRFLEGKQIVKEVYVPGKLVNFVVR